MLTAEEIRKLLTPLEFEVLLEIDKAGWMGTSVEVLAFRMRLTDGVVKAIITRLLNLELLSPGGHAWYAPPNYVCKPNLLEEVGIERRR